MARLQNAVRFAGLGSVVGIALLAGCASTPSCNSVKQASKAQQESLLGAMKKLEGKWEMKGQDGKMETITFAPTAMGTAVREVMFPGAPHEMTNMYHMDGESLLVTHYCAKGNQPRMRAVENKNGTIVFKADSVTNLDAKDNEFMGELTLTMKDANTLQEHWRSYKEGKVTEHVEFELKRAK